MMKVVWKTISDVRMAIHHALRALVMVQVFLRGDLPEGEFAAKLVNDVHTMTKVAALLNWKMLFDWIWLMEIIIWFIKVGKRLYSLAMVQVI